MHVGIVCPYSLAVPGGEQSIARPAFGPLAYAPTRRWLREHDLDVLHVHEPSAPSASLLALGPPNHPFTQLSDPRLVHQADQQLTDEPTQGTGPAAR